jgi:DNA polymerase/3'-5' exonuclease PolX
VSGATTDTRMERPVAVEIAKRFVAMIEDYADQLIVAGSLRRRLALIGDIEICAVPKVEIVRTETVGLFGSEFTSSEVDQLDFRMNELLEAGAVSKRLDANGSPRWGPTLKYLTFEGARVDLFCPSAERFGWILLLRTGPAEFSRQLVVPKGKRTKDNRPGLMPAYIKPDNGWLTYQTSGERIPTPTELSVFDLFGIPFVDPWSRV